MPTRMLTFAGEQRVLLRPANDQPSDDVNDLHAVLCGTGAPPVILLHLPVKSPHAPLSTRSSDSSRPQFLLLRPNPTRPGRRRTRPKRTRLLDPPLLSRAPR